MKYNINKLWNYFYQNSNEIYDYAGNLMKRSSIGNPNSKFEPTIDHIRPLSKGGTNDEDNLIICSRTTNQMKADNWNTWKINGKTFQARKIKGNKKGYKIVELDH